MLRPLLPPLVTALALAAWPPFASAAEQDAVRAGVATGQYKPLASILSEVAAAHAGRVVNVESKRGPLGDLRYEIKLVDGKGNKLKLLVDAATGQAIEQGSADRSQALTLAALADYLQQLKIPAHQHISDVEFEHDNQGRGVYLIKFNQSYQPGGRWVMSADTGQLLETRHASPGSGRIARVEDLLRAMAPRFSGLVLEVELKHDKHQRPYYEIELLQANGSTLELKVDAVTLELLTQKLED